MDIREGKIQNFECQSCWALLPYQGYHHNCPDEDDEVARNPENEEWMQIMNLILRDGTFQIKIVINLNFTCSLFRHFRLNSRYVLKIKTHL